MEEDDYKKVEKLIKECIENKSTSLELTLLKLSKLPEILSECVWLKNIFIDGTNVSDISTLKELKNLIGGTISNNQISDISAFKELKNLQQLDISNNQISDISTLKELKNLQQLDISNNQISDISTLKELNELQQLLISNNQVSDISALKELKDLQQLYVSNNQISDISALKELKELQFLNISDNRISDISALQVLISLLELNISSNQISDISALQGLKELHWLDISNNQIKEFPLFLHDFPFLSHLSLRENQFVFRKSDFYLKLLNTFDDNGNDIDIFNLIASDIEKQQKEQDEYIELRIEPIYFRMINQYLLLFKDYVKTMKGGKIDFYIRETDESLLLISNGKTDITREQIEIYLDEYLALLKTNFEKEPLHVENRNIDSVEVKREIDAFRLRYENQIAAIKAEMRILEWENKTLREDVENFQTQIESQDGRILFLSSKLEAANYHLHGKEKYVMYCENENATFFNGLSFSEIKFLSETDKSNVYMRIKAQKEVLGIIDRDYLSDEEVNTLRKNNSNLVVLDYYCFENYLYHPDNIAELFPDYDKFSYIEKIVKLKNEQFDDISLNLLNDHKSYIFFKLNHLSTSKNVKPILEMLKSDDFETFSKVFSMKNCGNLSGFNLGHDTSKLAQTDWFRNRFAELIKKVLPDLKF